jgi:hypothetical protein
MKLSKEQFLGILRHGLTFSGGILIMKGLVDESLWSEVLGGSIALAGSIWSIFEKVKS